MEVLTDSSFYAKELDGKRVFVIGGTRGGIGEAIIKREFNIFAKETKFQYNSVNAPTGGRTGHEQRRTGHNGFQGLIQQASFA